MTSKAVCPTHKGAYDVAAGCAYCEPAKSAEPDTERTNGQRVHDLLRAYIAGIDGAEIDETEWQALWTPDGMYR